MTIGGNRTLYGTCTISEGARAREPVSGAVVLSVEGEDATLVVIMRIWETNSAKLYHIQI